MRIWAQRLMVSALVSGTVVGSLALGAPPAGAVVPAPNPPNSTYYVSSNTAASGGSCGDPDYNTIAAALAVVVGGDTIVVCSGTYQEGALTVPSGVTELTIKGEVYPSLANPSVFPAVGPQAGAPVLDGRDATTPALRTRILDAPSTFVHLENLTFQYGKAPAEQSVMVGGGGVRAKRVSLDHMLFDNNEASDGIDPGAGGAVLAVDPSPANTAAAPTMDIDSSSFTNNTAAKRGGAVASRGYLAANNSSFDGNAAGNTTERSAWGGAIDGFLFESNAPIVVTASSFTNNSLVTDPTWTQNGSLTGTAISGGDITLLNSTVSKNTATGNFYFGPVYGVSNTIRFSTIVDNTATIGSCQSCFGALFFLSQLTLGGSLVAGNTSACVAGPYTDEGSNLSDLTADCAPTGTSQAVANLAALKLGTLGAQGTSGTQSYPLQADSPAVDFADCDLGSVLATALAVDQNGTVRPQGASCDAGSYEVGGAPPPPQPGVWIERSAGNGGPVLPEDCTAYPTISAAVADAFDNDVIHICPGLYVEDNTLNLLGLANITFVGDGDVPDDVQVDGGFPATGPNKHRIVNAAGQTVSFENLVLQNGYLEGAATHEGGAAVIASHVNATNVIFRNNRVVQSATGDNYGGAVSAGTATITDSAFSAHGTEVNGQSGSATLGGALYLSGAGASTITRTSFFHNVTHTDEVINSVTENTKGGAVFATGPLTVTDSYFIENGATFGGAIAALGTLTITNTVFDGNHNFASAAASQGGAVWAQGSATITDSEFLAKSEFSRDSANDPDEGVAVRAFGSLTISGSTFTDDFTTALKATGVVYSSATGGSPDVSITNSTFFRNDLQASTVVHAAGKVELVYVTAVNNTASGANVVDATDSLTITNSLFALNTGAASAVAGCNGGAGSAKTSTVSDSSCGDVVGSFSPSSFGAFTYHGAALTKTLELAAGNAGIAAANCAAAPTVTLDQNGTTRGATCDSGAMEYAVPDSDRSCPDDTVTTTVGVDTATGRPVCQLVLTADGDFDVPEGVSSVDVVLVGGGGGGGGGGTDSAGTATMSGGGGGGGSVSLHKGVTVTPLATIPVTVGSGGAYGAGGSPAEVWRGANGGDGGTTSFLSLAALGGKGGTGGGEEGGTYYVGAGGSTPAASSGESKNAAHSGASGATLRTWDINHYYTASGAGAGAGGAGSVGVLGPRFGLYSSTFGGAGGVGFTPADSTSLFGSDRWPWSLGDTNYNRFAAYVGLAMGGSGAITGVGNYDTYTFYCGRGASLHGWDWGWTGVGSSSGIIVLDGVITGTDADMEQPAGDGPCGASTGFAYGSGGGGGAGFQSWQADGSSGRAGAVIIRYVVPGVPGETGNGRVWIERDLGSGGVPVDEAGAQDDTVSCDHPTYASITAAVDAAVANDIVHVCSGTYREDEIVVDVDNLTIQGTEWVDPSPPARPVGPDSGVGETLLNHVVIDGELTEGDASTRHRIFDASGLSITFNNVVLQNGASDTYGGAVKAYQAVFVDSTLQDNTAPGGGAVFVGGAPADCGPVARLLPGVGRSCAPVIGLGDPVPSVTVFRSEFLRNGVVSTLDAPVPADGTTLYGSINGGAIYANDGLVVVTDSLFEDNEATALASVPVVTDGAGGAIIADSAEIYGSTFTNNLALCHGGAVLASSVIVDWNAQTRIGSSFSGNRATSTGTCVGTPLGDGGAIWTAGALIRRSTFTTNSAEGSGGAVGLTPSADPNAIQWGEGVTANQLVVDSVTFDRNSAVAGGGGAIRNLVELGAVTSTNSTYDSNSGGLVGGAIWSDGSATLDFNTFVGNTAGVFGGIYFVGQNKPVSLNSNIFSVASTTQPLADCYSSVPATDTASLTTLELANNGCPGSVTTETDLALGKLDSNGGPTQTVALLPGSVAVDAADSTVCPDAVDVDQRGNTRPVGKGCDVGAYEYFGTVDLTEAEPGVAGSFTTDNGVQTLHILLVGGGGGGGTPGDNGAAGGGGGGGEVVECTVTLDTNQSTVHYYFGLGGPEGEDGEDSWVKVGDATEPACLAHGGKAGHDGAAANGDAVPEGGFGGAAGITVPALPFRGGTAGLCPSLASVLLAQCASLDGYPLSGGGGGGAGGDGGNGSVNADLLLATGGAGGIGIAPSSIAFGDSSQLYGGGGGGGSLCFDTNSSGGDGGTGGGGAGATSPCSKRPVSAEPVTAGSGAAGGGGGGGAGSIGGGGGGDGSLEVRTAPPLGPDDIVQVCLYKQYVTYGAKYFNPKVYYCIPDPCVSTPASPTRNGSVSRLDPECCPAVGAPTGSSSVTTRDPECCPVPTAPAGSGPVTARDPECCPVAAPVTGSGPSSCVLDLVSAEATDGYSTVLGDEVLVSGSVSELSGLVDDEPVELLATPAPLHYDHIPDGYIKVNPDEYPDLVPPTCSTEYAPGDGVTDPDDPSTWLEITCTGGDPGDKMFDYSLIEGLRIYPAVLTVKPKHLRVPFGSPEPSPYEFTVKGFKLGETADTAEDFEAPKCDSEYDPATAEAGDRFDITCEEGAAKNYVFRYKSSHIHVEKQRVRVRPADVTITYGDPVPGVRWAVSGIRGPESAFAPERLAGFVAPTCSTTYVTGAAAGTYSLSCEGASSKNYEFVAERATLTVLKAPLRVVPRPATAVYGSSSPAVVFDLDGFVNGEVSPGSGYRAPVCTAAGFTPTAPAGSQLPVTCAGAVSRNYEFDMSSTSLVTVTKAPLAVVPASRSVVYGQAVPAYTFEVTGWRNGESPSTNPAGLVMPTCGSTYVPTASAGSTSTIVCAGGAANNYSFDTSATASLTVGKATLLVTPDQRSTTYGQATPTPTFTVTGFANSQNPLTASGYVAPTCSTTHTAASNAGVYPITCTGGAAANYAFAYAPGQVTVNKAVLRAMPTNTTVVYGTSSAPAAGLTVTGFLFGQTTSTASGYRAPVCNMVGYSSATNVGQYPVSCSGGSSANYTFDTSATSLLTVTRAPATITASSQTITYGSPTPTWAHTISGLKNGQTATTVAGMVAPLCSSGYSALSNAGTVATISCSGASANNYSFTYVTGKATVTKATLTVTPNNVTIARGSAIPTFTTVTTGWQNAQGAANAAGYVKPVCKTNYTTRSAAGSYTITCSGGSATNYAFVYRTGVLTVN